MIRTKSSILIMMLLIITTTGLTTADASHGGSVSGGGGCGNCIPPTLGIDKDGITRVSGGISINSVVFDVEYYSQDMPVQILNQGEKTSVVLKIFEDQGVDYVTHAELHFAPYDKVINGILVEHSIAHFVWHNEYGDKTIGIYDDDKIFQDVVIDAKNTDGFKIITFEFKPMMIMDQTTLMTRVWDERKNVVNNYFVDAIKVIDADNPKSSQTNKIQSEIPSWVKNNAGWWADGKIGDDSFVQGIQFLIKEGIVQIPTTTQNLEFPSSEIPSWVKNNAGWWADGKIGDDSFVQGIQFLIKEGIVQIQN